MRATRIEHTLGVHHKDGAQYQTHQEDNATHRSDPLGLQVGRHFGLWALGVAQTHDVRT